VGETVVFEDRAVTLRLDCFSEGLGAPFEFSPLLAVCSSSCWVVTEARVRWRKNPENANNLKSAALLYLGRIVAVLVLGCGRLLEESVLAPEHQRGYHHVAQIVEHID
jgi:hypothetical protein